jgi:hypothetical protein
MADKPLFDLRVRFLRAQLRATEPTSWATPCVNDRYDHKFGLLNAKVESVRKTRHRCAPDIAMNKGILQWMLVE